MQSIEASIVRFAAPVLAGIKPASLFSIPFNPFNISKIYRIKLILNTVGVDIKLMCSCKQRIRLFVFRPLILSELLKNQKVIDYLLKQGYKTQKGLYSLVSELKSRLNNSAHFPHEVGIFLGYPLEDVIEFIMQKGKNSKFYGYWKVYSSPENARKQFKKYDYCKKHLMFKYMRGINLQQLCKVI